MVDPKARLIGVVAQSSTAYYAASIPTRIKSVAVEGLPRYVSQYSSTLLRVPVLDQRAYKPMYTRHRDLWSHVSLLPGPTWSLAVVLVVVQRLNEVT